MNRRDLLKRLGFAAPALIATSTILELGASATPPPSSTPSPSPSPSPKPLTYQGWEIYWSGWREIFNQDVLSGWWVANSPAPSDYQLYSAYPGRCDWCVKGAVFNLGLQSEWQVLPSIASTIADLTRYQLEALEKLKQLIDAVGKPPLSNFVISWKQINQAATARLGSESLEMKE